MAATFPIADRVCSKVAQAPALDRFPHRRNSLNALRLVLAVLVIVSHSWPLGGFGADPVVGDSTLGELAVAGFFTISGWLILQSRLGGTLPGYLWRRFVRIYPGFLVSLLAVAFVFAPLGALLSTGTYSLHAAVAHVRANLWLYMDSYHVGASLPPEHAHGWNGSLWTLASEAACYVVVGVLVSVCPRRALGPAVIGGWALLTVLQMARAAEGAHFFLNDFLALSPFFFAGAALFTVRSRVPMCGTVAAAAAVLLGLMWFIAADRAIGAVPIAYLMMWLGAVLPLHALGARHDLSYGMYVYAFPVQQLLAVIGATALGVGPYALASILLTVPFAAASWWLVERPAQRLRGLFDGRGPAEPGTGGHRSRQA